MQVNEFTVGPILGFVEPKRARVFGRARLKWKAAGPPPDHDEAPDARQPTRCFGVLRWKRKGSRNWGKPTFFKTLPHFDFTGVGVLGRLSPGTEYEYQGGWFYTDDDRELPDPRDGERLQWDSEHPTYTFRSATSDPEEQRSFVFGSCRYLLRLFGGVVFEGRGDKTFLRMLQQMEKGVQTDAVLMLGDQIYADDLNFLSPDSQIDEFLARYRAAFAQKHIRKLMASVPTYMTLDDHEIEDNWPHKADPRDMQIKYPAAIHSYTIYQASHSPLGIIPEGKSTLQGLENRFWYTFSDGCCDFFVTDVRTERRVDTEIISGEQMRELKEWLVSGTDRVKIIVSSVPIFPDHREPGYDKWAGFQPQRDELLNYIHDRKVRKVITLSGDVHTSMSAELVSEQDPDFRILSVVSSPFYWPYPHPSKKDFQLVGRIQSQSPYGFHITGATDPVTTENFTRLTIHPLGAEVKVFGRKGRKALRSHTFPF